MISHLHIENFAVIESTDIFWGPGFNVLTGETGAGKSIIITAINAIFGGRLSRDMIREGFEKLLVSAVINCITNAETELINSLGYEAEEKTILLYREFNQSGKNICKINGRPATVSILKKLSSSLIDIYSQHEGYKLLSAENHVKYIDLFAKNEKILEEYKNIYENMNEMGKKLQELNLDEREAQRKIAILEYEIDEIEKANIQEGELERLKEVKKKQINQQKIILNLGEVKSLLNGREENKGAIEQVEKSAGILFETAEYIKEMESLGKRLQNSFYEISECLNEVIDAYNDMEYAPQELEYTEERLDLLYKLSRKYGKTEKEILEFLSSAKKEMLELKTREEKSEELELEFNKLKKEVLEKGEEISAKRAKAAEELAKKVEEELVFLNMPYAKFKVKQEKSEPGVNGIDKIKFLISVNEGEPLKPIENVASGGELSRIMLGIKNVVSTQGENTIVFDEVDTGVSGSAARKIGLKLKELAGKKQVISITHLAQIASMADEHFIVEKATVNGRTFSSVNKLNFEERKKELARIIGGKEGSESVLKTAEEMLKTSI